VAIVERMMECHRAARMPALQCFISDLEEKDETCADILSDTKCFILYFKKENILYRMFRLSYCTTICNTNEYKLMCQGNNLGQLYDIHNRIKITRKLWLGLLIYYDNHKR
jgi:hypothetical protein